MFSSLDQRSRITLYGGFAAVILILMGYFLQIQGRKEDVLRRRIAATEREISEVREMGRDIKRLEEEVNELPGPLSGRPVELFSILEKEMKGLGIKPGDMRIRPLASENREDYEEKSVEVKADKLPLQTLVDLLYAVENHPKGLRIVAFKADKRYDDDKLIDASFKVSMFYELKEAK